MRSARSSFLSATLAAAFALSSSSAQTNGSDIYWHTDHNVKDCSMVIDPSLTQGEWRTFVKQVGAVTSFKTLASAKPLGFMEYVVGIDMSYSPIDQHDRAWINTFTHPDETCPLGDVIAIPTFRGRIGVSDRMDVGAYWTSAPDANYGIVGAEFRYALSAESETMPAVAARGSVTILTGVSDFDASIYGLEASASKTIGYVTPYAGLRGILAVGSETTTKVDLSREMIPLAQAFVGVTGSIWVLDVAAEYNVSVVNTFALVVGVKL